MEQKMYQRVNELLGTKYQSDNELDWYKISVYQRLSEDFIREFYEYVDWDFISINQRLSEDFIREYQEYVDWDAISIYQDLSDDFIEEFKDYLSD